VMFFAIYLPVIGSEEQFLRAKFPEFDEYARHVPRILPRITPAHFGGAGGGFSTELYLKHREWNALLGAVAILVVLVIEMIFVSKS